MFYLMMHSTQFILKLNGVGHMVKDESKLMLTIKTNDTKNHTHQTIIK